MEESESLLTSAKYFLEGEYWEYFMELERAVGNPTGEYTVGVTADTAKARKTD